jgi:hypothetical protein
MIAGAVRHPGGRRSGARLALSVLLTCVATLVVGTAGARASTGSIEGTVTNLSKGEPLQGIAVTADGRGVLDGAITPSDGSFAIAGLPAGTYEVTVVDPGHNYVTVTEPEIVVEEGKATKLDVAMERGAAISGTVTNASSGVGLAGVSVTASNEVFDQTDTEEFGHYKMSDLPPGLYFVSFGLTDFVFQSTSVTLGEGEDGIVNAALAEEAKISGRVTSAVTHEGLAKIEVAAISETGRSASTSTNPNGEYTIDGLPTGSYTVRFRWEFSGEEVKEFEHAPRRIPKYITQYYNDQPSEATVNLVAATIEHTTSGIDAAMVPSAPVNTVLPAVSGTPNVSSVLSCSTGSWTGEPEVTLAAGWPLTNLFGYQWLRDGAAITGANSAGYTVQTSDESHSLACEVTATNDAGHTSATSNSLAVPAPVPVVSTSASTLVVLKHATKVPVTCAGATCTGSIDVVGQIADRKKHRTLMLATGSYSLAAGRREMTTLHLNGSGEKALAQARHHRIACKLVITVAGGKKIEKKVQVSLAVRR